MQDLDLLESVAGNIAGKTLCAFGDAAATPVLTTLKHFRHEYEAHVTEGRCTLPAAWRARHAARWRRTLHAAMTASRSSPSIVLIARRLRSCCCCSAAVMVYAERKIAAQHAAAARPVPGRAAGRCCSRSPTSSS